MPFLTPIRVEKTFFRDIWTLLHEFWYHHAPTETIDLDVTVTVPAGFMTDFASVPRLPLIYYVCGNQAHEASVVHDYLYSLDSMPLVDKNTADRIFYDAMIEMGLDRHIARMMYDGVVIGGESHFHKRSVKDRLEVK
jgi:hypothetical protein